MPSFINISWVITIYHYFIESIDFYKSRLLVKYIKAHFHRLLEPQHWISTLPFDLNIEFQHWQFTSMLKWNFNINPICSMLKFHLNIEVNSWCGNSMLRSNVNVKIQCWGQMSMLKFNVEILKACKNEALMHRCKSTKKQSNRLKTSKSMQLKAPNYFLIVK